MYVMRGAMPLDIMARYVRNPFMGLGIRLFAGLLIRPEPFSEAYFLEDALKVRKVVKLPLIYVGGLTSGEGIEKVLDHGFEFVQIARALIHDPAFISKLESGEITASGCRHTNYCIARMYSEKMVCFQQAGDLPARWKNRL
jgi:2,4-dienoyl-CoA reductase-like NADH-dependent reductase (Old Yellow Enzyme family)